MFFPIVVPITVGANQQKQEPLLDTLCDYTELSNEVFKNKFYEKLSTTKLGISEAFNLVSDYYEFDILKEKNKRNLIAFVEDPAYGSFKYFLKQLFSK